MNLSYLDLTAGQVLDDAKSPAYKGANGRLYKDADEAVHTFGIWGSGTVAWELVTPIDSPPHYVFISFEPMRHERKTEDHDQ